MTASSTEPLLMDEDGDDNMQEAENLPMKVYFHFIA